MSKFLKFCLAISLALLLGCLLYSTWTAISDRTCQQRSIPPKAPVYPESTLINHDEFLIGSSRPIVTDDYISMDSSEKITAFYREIGTCGLGDNPKHEICHGDAIPMGEYFVYIDLDSYVTKGRTSYTIEVRWHGCTYRLDM